MCERIGRRWLCIDTVKEYLKGALARFAPGGKASPSASPRSESLDAGYYNVPRPGLLWGSAGSEALDPAGGQRRKPPLQKEQGMETNAPCRLSSRNASSLFANPSSESSPPGTCPATPWQANPQGLTPFPAALFPGTQQP